MTTPFPPRGPYTRPCHRGATILVPPPPPFPAGSRPPASRPPSGGYSLKPRRISLARSSVADMVLPRRAAGGRGWAGLAWLRGPGREGGGDSGASGPPHPAPLTPSHPPLAGATNPSGLPPPRRPAPCLQRHQSRTVTAPPPRLQAPEGRGGCPIRKRVCSPRLPPSPPHSGAAAQRSLRRPPRPAPPRPDVAGGRESLQDKPSPVAPPAAGGSGCCAGPHRRRERTPLLAADRGRRGLSGVSSRG